MEKNQNKQAVKSKSEEPKKQPENPIPIKPNTPAQPDINQDPTKLLPAVEEPKKNNPTRIEEKPTVQPEQPKR